MFCISINTKPTPNSIAESTKKKKVNETRFKLSKIVPTHKTIRYRVIHKSSAVKSRWRAVVTLVLILAKRIKNTII